MSEQNNGGPAFPVSDPFGVKCPPNEAEALRLQQGMTLRDYFAAKALQGFAAHLGGATKRGNETGPEANARLAYEYADAMLKARG